MDGKSLKVENFFCRSHNVSKEKTAPEKSQAQFCERPPFMLLVSLWLHAATTR